MQLIIGIDPGKSGGIAVIDADGHISVAKMPATIGDIHSYLHQFRPDSVSAVRAVIEKLGQLPRGKDGRPMQSSKSTKVLYRNYGHCEMALTSLGIPYREATASKWQRWSGVYGKYASQTIKKNVHKDEAQRRFPGVKMTHAIADALLIADYGLREVWRE